MEGTRTSCKGHKVALNHQKHEGCPLGRASHSSRKTKKDCEPEMSLLHCYSDEGDEWPVQISRETAASVFRLESTTNIDPFVDNPRTPSDGSISQLLGDFMDDLNSNKVEDKLELQDEFDDVFDPIPLNFLRARGVPVGIECTGTYNSTHSAMKCERNTSERLNTTLCRDEESPSVDVHSPSLGSPSDTQDSTLKRTITSTSGVQESNTSSKRARPNTSSSHAESREARPVYSIPETPLDRFLWYLKFNKSEQESWMAVQDIVKHCEMKRKAGVRKFQNMPGAVFELAVDILGAEKFQALFQTSQKVKHCHSGNIIIERNATGRKGVNDEVTQAPTLVETAVAYGFHMARIHILHDTSDGTPVRDILGKGIDTVKRMSDAERTQFWKYMMRSKLCENTTSKQSGR